MSEFDLSPHEGSVHGWSQDAGSPPYTLLFVLGSPRSGTTWVQLLLDKSPDVATAPETQIFAYYLDHFRKQWIEEHSGPSARLQGGAGLHRLLSERDFLSLCAHTARYVLDRIWDQAPGASVVLEKSPRHALVADWILAVFPDAHILHVIRDPRDASASIMEAGRSWGGSWAPTNPIDAARLWRVHVEKARESDHGNRRYVEIRYEELKKSPASVLYDLLQWLDIPQDIAFCEEAAEACALDRLRSHSESSETAPLPVPGKRSPKGFFGKGTVGGWTDRVSRPSAACIERVCFDIMNELGYEPEIVSSGRRSPRIVAHDLIQRFREMVDWQLERLKRHI